MNTGLKWVDPPRIADCSASAMSIWAVSTICSPTSPDASRTQKGPPPAVPRVGTTPQTRDGRPALRASSRAIPARIRSALTAGPWNGSGCMLSMFFIAMSS